MARLLLMRIPSSDSGLLGFSMGAKRAITMTEAAFIKKPVSVYLPGTDKMSATGAET